MQTLTINIQNDGLEITSEEDIEDYLKMKVEIRKSAIKDLQHILEPFLILQLLVEFYIEKIVI